MQFFTKALCAAALTGTLAAVAPAAPMDAITGTNTDTAAVDQFKVTGFEFTVASPITVTALGVFDIFIGDFETAKVGLWDSTGLLGQVDVSGNKAPANFAFGFTDLAAPVTLSTGVTYTVGATNYYASGPAGVFAVSPDITITKYVSHGVGGFSSLSQPTTTNANANFGANFQYVVPEPASLGLLSLGGLALLGRRRRTE